MSAPIKMICMRRIASVSICDNITRLFNGKGECFKRVSTCIQNRNTSSLGVTSSQVDKKYKKHEDYARDNHTAVLSTFDLPFRSNNAGASLVRHLSTGTKRNCWKCGRETDLETELYFCECGVVQSLNDVSYFKLFGIDESFDIDIHALSTKFKDLQRLLHPDRHSQKSKKEQELSEVQSSAVNKAYFTLLKPLPRAQYMLELNGYPLEEENTDVDKEFLMEIMELNEEIMDAESPEDLKDSETANKHRIEECVEHVSKAFSCGDYPLAKELVIKLRYFTNIEEKIKELYRLNF